MENKNIELIQQYKQLLDSGVITQEEFEAKKKQILEKEPVINSGSNSNDGFYGYGHEDTSSPSYDTGSFGWAVLGFFIPLVGLILYLVWKNDKPNNAKKAGIGALVGFVLGIALQVVAGVLGALFSVLTFY